MPKGLSCWRCGRTDTEIARSDQLRADVCRWCLPMVSPAPAAPPRPPREPRAKPSAFARLHTRVWGRLASKGDVFLLGRNHIAGWCPVCGAGALEIRFIDVDPPRIRTDGCSDGCTPDLIFDAL